MCLGGGSVPRVSRPKPAPAVEDPAVQEAILKERELARRRAGRRSTILTPMSGLGTTGQKKTLLGE